METKQNHSQPKTNRRTIAVNYHDHSFSSIYLGTGHTLFAQRSLWTHRTHNTGWSRWTLWIVHGDNRLQRHFNTHSRGQTHKLGSKNQGNQPIKSFTYRFTGETSFAIQTRHSMAWRTCWTRRTWGPGFSLCFRWKTIYKRAIIEYEQKGK